MLINYKEEAISRNKRFEYIPIDFIKCKIINFPKEELLNNPLLDFISHVNLETGELKPKREAYYKNLKFTVEESGFIEISGSIHKYFNDGMHNHNDFTYLNYKSALKRIYEDFKIEPKNMWIQNIEYGVNITPPLSCNQILNNCFLHKKLPISMPQNSKFAHYIQAEHKSNYILKIYDKAKQYRPKYNELKGVEILRIEVKQIRLSKYRKMGIETLEDFNKFDKAIFVNDLLNKWEEVIFFNPLSNNSKFSNPFSNANYWENLLYKNPKTYYNKIKNLKKQNSNNCLDIQIEIMNTIIENIKKLNLK